jgi:hypothetical protein
LSKLIRLNLSRLVRMLFGRVVIIDIVVLLSFDQRTSCLDPLSIQLWLDICIVSTCFVRVNWLIFVGAKITVTPEYRLSSSILN